MRRRVVSWIGFGRKLSQIGLAPDGFELVFLGGRGAPVDLDEVADVALRLVFVLDLDEDGCGLGEPFASVFEAALECRKNTELTVGHRGMLEIAALLRDSQRL